MRQNIEQHARKFCDAIFGKEQTEFRMIGYRKPTISLFGTVAEHEAELVRLNNSGYGIYVVINKIGNVNAVKARYDKEMAARAEANARGIERKNGPASTGDADIISPRYVFADFDVPETADGEHLETASQHIAPSVFTQTSPGKHHAFWLTSDLPLAAFTVAQKGIAVCYGSDKAICNPARIMRVPGFIHHGKSVSKKNPIAIPPSVSLLIDCDDEEYTRDDIALIVADAPTAEPRGDKAKTAFSGQKKTASGAVAAFNSKYPLADILTKHGYKLIGKKWLTPHSTTGMPGIIFNSDGGERVYSYHDSDPLCDGHAHDSFSAFKMLEHGGNFDTAMAEAKRLLGWRKKAQKKQAVKDDPRPQIKNIGSDVGEMCRVADRSMAKTGDIYQRAGALVRPVRLDQMDGVSRIAGALALADVDDAWLRKQLTIRINWLSYDARNKTWQSTMCPSHVPRMILSSMGEWTAPYVTGVIESPTIRADGSLLTSPGYDKNSRLYLDYVGDVSGIPENPTKKQAVEALEIIKKPFSEFPFVESKLDLSVVLAGVLTAISRQSVPSAPLIGFDAPKAGSGKSLLIDCISMIATGRRAAVLSQGSTEEEDEKRIGALLIRGASAVVSIDNVERPIRGDLLCSMLTQPAVSVRVLGQSKMMDLPTNLSMFATGNNLVFAGDMTRRVLLCRVDSNTERPDGRRFSVNLYRSIPENRDRLIVAALTILRAWKISRETIDVIPFGGFEDWSELVRKSLIWLGLPDPLLTRDRVLDSDPVASVIGLIFAAMYSAFGLAAKTASEMIEFCSFSSNDAHILRSALMDVAQNRRGDGIDSRRLGAWLRKYSRRIEGGYKLQQKGVSHSAKLWRVENIGGVRELGESSLYPEEEITERYKEEKQQEKKNVIALSRKNQGRGRTDSPDSLTPRSKNLTPGILSVLLRGDADLSPEDFISGEFKSDFGGIQLAGVLSVYQAALASGEIPTPIPAFEEPSS